MSTAPLLDGGSPYLTAEEAAAYLRYASVRALYKSIPVVGIPFRRRGRTFLFHKGDLDRWLAGEPSAEIRREARSKSLRVVRHG